VTDQKYRILIVEDNEALLFNTKLKLEMSGYDVLSAINGQDALNVLAKNPPPHIILSDIMMPIMDGYSFYSKVSENPTLNKIPFIFITAKSSPEDIRFAKKLGVDDYIIKPFKGEDLLATIEGKLKRASINTNVQSQYSKELLEIETKLKENKIAFDQQELVLFIIDWDEQVGPVITDYFPKDEKEKTSLEDIGLKLYNTSSAIYDTKDWSKDSNVLLHINYIDMDAVLYFATYNDLNVRGGQSLFMVVALAKKINYFESLRIQEILKSLALNIEKYLVDGFPMEDYWKKIKEILK
jgi:CheY-like chemotaxis protein